MSIEHSTRGNLVSALLGVFLLMMGSFADARTYGPHKGYLYDVQTERERQAAELVTIPTRPDAVPSIQDKIFSQELTKEFKERYEEKFGRTEVERVYLSPNKYSYYDDMYSFRGSAQETDDAKREFGNYMLRRLLEFHVDDYAKHEPKVRPVWEAKERLSKVDVQVGPQMHLDIRYSLAANNLNLNVRNPWLDAKMTLQMNPGRFGPTNEIDEAIMTIGRALTKSIYFDSHYAVTDGILTLVGTKSITSNLGTSLTMSTFTTASGHSVRESRYLSGLSYIF